MFRFEGFRCSRGKQVEDEMATAAFSGDIYI